MTTDDTVSASDSDEKKLKRVEDVMGSFLKGDRLDDDERYNKTIETIYNKLKPIWMNECKDAMWLLQDDYVREVAKIIYLDDQMGGNLDPSSLSRERQNLLGWKQVQSTIERYRALDYSLVDSEQIKAILSSIIKNSNARDIDKLKAIEMYTEMFNGEQIGGITFICDLDSPKNKKSRDDDVEEN